MIIFTCKEYHYPRALLEQCDRASAPESVGSTQKILRTRVNRPPVLP